MSKIVTMFELESLPTGALEAMYQRITAEHARSRRGNAERRNALASLENIQRVLNRRGAFRSPSM